MPPLTLMVRTAALVLLAQSPLPTPIRVGGWRTAGPALYQVNAVATEPANETAVYAAASIYGVSESAVFRSANGGRSWTTLVEASPGTFYSELLVDPRQPLRIYAGALDPGGSHIERSADGGATWATTHAFSLSCVPSFAPGAAPDTVLSTCGSKLLRSADGGATWVDLPAPFVEPTRLVAGGSGAVLAYGAGAIFRTTNEGATWTPLASAPAACAGILSLRVDPLDESVLVAGTGRLGVGGFLCGGVFRSIDGGKNWGPNTLPGFYVTDIAILARNPAVIFASASFLSGILPRGGVFESSDSGATWSNLHLPASGAVRLALSPNGWLLHAATSLGVFDRGFRRTTTLAPR